MRSEKTMFQLFLDIANADSRILAVYLNGSRTDRNAPKDIFQDYDIVFVVTRTADFIREEGWICKFGTVLYMQRPDEHPDCASDKENFYGWLMQFDDGVRVDLHVESIPHAKAHICEDKLCQILLDKEHILPKIPEATDEGYYVKKPSQTQFLACANEFWWCTNNLAKGLWREEMPYVQDMANFIVRKELEKMLSWKVGLATGFQASIGKSAKYLGRWLGQEEYREYLGTYFGGTAEEAWEAIVRMCGMFGRVAREVADGLGYFYDTQEEAAALKFLVHVRHLPKDAKEIY